MRFAKRLLAALILFCAFGWSSVVLADTIEAAKITKLSANTAGNVYVYISSADAKKVVPSTGSKCFNAANSEYTLFLLYSGSKANALVSVLMASYLNKKPIFIETLSTGRCDIKAATLK